MHKLHRESKSVPFLACYNFDIVESWMEFDIFWQKCYR